MITEAERILTLFRENLYYGDPIWPIAAAIGLTILLVARRIFVRASKSS